MILLKLQILNTLMILLGVFLFVMLAIFTFYSIIEKERRATIISLILVFIISLPFLLIGLLDFQFQSILSIVLLSLTCLIILLFLLPLGTEVKDYPDIPKLRFDERDVIFSRWKLKKGSKYFEEYYNRHPEKEKVDNKFRAAPGILSENASKFHPILFPATKASDDTVDFLRKLEYKPFEKSQKINEPERITEFLKNWIKYLGAHSVGITLLKHYHYYSHKGRGDEYGLPIQPDNKYAIVFTSEMNRQMNLMGPEVPTCMETNKQYLNVAVLASQVGNFISRLGYSSRTHIDGNYRVICPLVARDAGLGEFGRMGLLMTPKLGPRIRIAVVSTDLPLLPDERKRDLTMIDFCNRCKKCAEICPSSSIPFDGAKEIDGVLRWKVNHDTCFSYWSQIGTDCGRCIAVCPFSHPNNYFHNLVRKAIRKSSAFRMIAVPLEDLFYGRKPSPKKLDKWLEV